MGCELFINRSFSEGLRIKYEYTNLGETEVEQNTYSINEIPTPEFQYLITENPEGLIYRKWLYQLLFFYWLIG